MSDKFHDFAVAVEAQFRSLAAAGELYTVDATDTFERYLAAFPEGTNELFRVRTEHDCSCCKNFIRNIGHVVSLTDTAIKLTVWDVGPVDLPHPYNVVAETMADYVRSLPIKGVFRTKERKYGNQSTLEMRNDWNEPFRWHHFWCDVPRQNITANPEEARGRVNTAIGVFKRGLEELTIEALNTVMELIDQNALYRGAEFRDSLFKFRQLHALYAQTLSEEREAFIWKNAAKPVALFRNTVIGTLAVDLSSGVDLEHAVRSFEQKVAPMNYKRPTSLITERMVKDAVGKLNELGLESAVERRFARLADVSVNNVLWVDNSVRSAMKDGLTGLLLDAVKPRVVEVKNAEPVVMDDFLTRIVPQAQSIDLLLENKHLTNFMSVTAPVHSDAGRLFKWDNGFAWSYDGDAADSIKQRVKRAGGKIDADLRVSLAWFNTDDLDLHVHEPNGSHIYYGDKRPHRSNGHLDVDMNVHNLVRDPVENVVWNKPVSGVYRIDVHQFTRRESLDVGFTLEVDCGGTSYQFSYNKAVSGTIRSLSLHMDRGQLVFIEANKELKAGSTSQEKWGVSTEALVPVNTLMASPNHWDGQGVGNKHWFFILKDCLNPEPARGIYNEFLKSELDPHRKVFEILGAKSKCPPAQDQLSGVGFSSTRQDTATVVVKGKTINKAFSIQF